MAGRSRFTVEGSAGSGDNLIESFKPAIVRIDEGTGDPHGITPVFDIAGLSRRSIKVARIECAGSMEDGVTMAAVFTIVMPPASTD
jgi:hypothetical protein